MKKTWIQIKVGLIRDPKHRERMGNTVWLYMHMIDRIDWETGKVYDWKDKEEAEDMCMSWRTLQQWRQKLDDLNYVTCIQRGNSQEITVHKWSNPREYSGKTYNPTGGGTENRVPISGQGTMEGTIEVHSKRSTPSLYSKNKDHTLIKEQELNIWEQVKEGYKLQETGQLDSLSLYKRFIGSSIYIGEKNNGKKTELVVRCETQEQRDWLDGNFKGTAMRMLMGYYNKPAADIALRFVYE